MRFRPALHAVALAALLSSCDEATDPAGDAALAFGAETVGLGEARAASIVVRNTGSAAVGPIEVSAGPVTRAGLELPGVDVLSAPDEIPTLNPGDSAIVELTVTGANGLQAGRYTSELRARVQGDALASAMIMFDVVAAASVVGAVEITESPEALRQGDVAQFAAVVYDTLGQVIEDATVTWATSSGAGLFTTNAEFLPYGTGEVFVIAVAGDKADTLFYDVAPRGVEGTISVVGHSSLVSRYTSDSWLHGNVAYTGTWGTRQASGNTMYAWDISGPTPTLSDSLQVVAFTVNDVKIAADGSFAVLTHEYMPTPHAITLVDMTDPLHPTVAGEFLADVPTGWTGVHNVWIDGDYVYIVVDGTAANRGLWIIDVSDRANPVRVGRFFGGSSFLHDVYVRDGLAFLSHWNAGLIILDVGHGIRGGSPSNPVEVSRILTSGGDVHNAWYWPETGYVFVGEEDFGTPGRMHIVDASDLENPVEVASFRISGDTPHNFWLDEENAVLYTSWYSRGVQAVDVSGRLIGSLDLQGRIIDSLEYAGFGGCPGVASTCTWSPQLHNGYLYVADMNYGIWKLQTDF